MKQKFPLLCGKESGDSNRNLRRIARNGLAWIGMDCCLIRLRRERLRSIVKRSFRRLATNQTIAMTSSMMGCCSGVRGRRASHKLRHQQHGKASRNPFFREEQASAFRGHQFDLLEQNPPSFNPEYVGNPPSYNPHVCATTPRSVSSSSSSMFGDEAFLALDSPAAHPRHCRRRSSNNPFEEDVPCISVQAVPVASAVPISDTEEEDIPFVSALPVKGDGNDHELHIYESPRPTMVQPQNLPRPATRAARPPQAQFPQWRERPPVAQHQQRNEIPTWLVLNPNAQRTIHTNASRCANRTQRRWSGSNPQPRRSKPRSSSLVNTTNRGNWSRISVLTKAAAGDARRNFSKKAPSCNGYRRW